MKTICCAFFCLIWVFSSSVSASRSGEEVHFSRQQVANFAKKVEKTVAQKGARVFIIARTGRPLSELPPGIRYTHTAFGVYSRINTSDGRTIPGYAMYNLYQKQDRLDRSELITDFPVDFFFCFYQLKAGVIIPIPELQKRLLQLIQSGAYRKLHNPIYSALANPFTSRFQNCTEYVLDVLNAAIYQTNDIKQLKANASAYFQPRKIHSNFLKLLLGTIFSPDIALSDHEETPKTATFTTIADYMTKYRMVREIITITADVGIRN